MKIKNSKAKSIGIFVLVLVLLSSSLLPITVFGSSNGEAVAKYTVKKGDNLSTIAASYGVTVSNIVSANGISASSTLYPGQVLKIPAASSVQEDSTTSYASSSTVSIDVKDADLKGVLSAVLAHTGYTMVFKGDTTNVTLSLEDVSPLTAIDYILRMVDMTYIKNDNVIYVGNSAVLNASFIDNKALTKVKLKYISIDTLVTQLSALGVPLNVIKAENNLGEFWVSAYPMELAKMHELIKTLDFKENLTLSSAELSSNLTAIEMKYLTASEFSSLLGSLGLNAGITMEAHPMTLYVYVTGEAYNDIMRIKKLVDYKDKNAAKKEDADKETKADVVISDGETSLVKVDLKYLTKDSVTSIVSTFGYEVEVLGLDLYEKRVWLRGTTAEVDSALKTIKENDTANNNSAKTFFTYELQNIVASELQSKIAYLDIENVEFYFGSYPEITKSIMVYCPTNRVDEVKEVLASLDDNLGKIYYPVETVTDINLLSILPAKEELVVKFANIPSITADAFAVSADLDPSDEGVKYVVYVLESPENIDVILNLWSQF